MNRYTIPCTSEQTKKAFELGAPIHTAKQSWGCEIIEINKINDLIK